MENKIFGHIQAVFVEVFDGRHVGILTEQLVQAVFVDQNMTGHLSDSQRLPIVLVDIIQHRMKKLCFLIIQRLPDLTVFTEKLLKNLGKKIQNLKIAQGFILPA